MVRRMFLIHKIIGSNPIIPNQTLLIHLIFIAMVKW